MVLLFVVCGWREETARGWREFVNVRTWYILHTYFFVPEATKNGKIVNPAVRIDLRKINIFQYHYFGERDESLERLYAQLCSVYARFICGGNVFCNLL